MPFVFISLLFFFFFSSRRRHTRCSRDWSSDVCSSDLGLRFLSPGVQSSGELLTDLLKNPRFTGAELAVRAFLAFLFLGLLILKVFQPRSVGVYFNEQLHSIHDEYRKGLFDSYLPEAQRAGTGGTIEPLRFEDWCLNTYSVIR